MTTYLIFLAFLLIASYVSCDGDIVGKVVVSYSLRSHWSDRLPNSINTRFDIYPDTRDYQKLLPTGYKKLGNGQAANLFNFEDESSSELHMKWITENHIDVVGIERNGSGTYLDLNGVQNRKIRPLRSAATKYNKKFFIIYDIAGWDRFETHIFSDITYSLKRELNIFNSSVYAYQNGKPVLGIRGLGFSSDQYGTYKRTLYMIEALKHDFYVIGEVPIYWREEINSKKNYRDIYLALDMLQPYTVGELKSVEEAKKYASVLKEDYELLKQYKIEYQPVVFPGMSRFHSSSGQRPKNEIPRVHGDFLWQQFVNIRSLGIKNCFVQKFDGFDDGTAIIKSAENTSMIPTGEWFLTLDTDGVRMSSDFYLRLVADGSRMIKGQTPLQQKLPTKFVL